MSNPSTLEAVRQKYNLLEPLMTERLRRQWAACEAQTLGRGGVHLVAQATGLSRTTIWAGQRELRRRADYPQEDLVPQRIRAPGAGRPLLKDHDPTLLAALRDLVESTTRGDPQSPLCWTSKSTRHLAEELQSQGHAVSHQTVATLLDELGYSLQANRKTREGKGHPDRDAQFEYIPAGARSLTTLSGDRGVLSFPSPACWSPTRGQQLRSRQCGVAGFRQLYSATGTWPVVALVLE